MLLLSLLIAAAAAATPADTVLVSTAWLAERLRDPRLVILHAASSRAAYDSAHVPGARYIPFDAFALRERGGLSTELPPVATLESLLEEAGVSDDSRIVIVGSPIAAGRLLMTLDHLGLGAHTSVLDGGMTAWKEEGRVVTADVPAVARGSLTPRPREVVVDVAWMKSRLRRPGTSLVDARAPQFYAGNHDPSEMAARPGHIPGAVSIPFTTIADRSGKYADVETLRELFRTAGVKPGDLVVTYCHVGMQASVLYLAARLLGHDARLYDGSYQEWSRPGSTNVER